MALQQLPVWLRSPERAFEVVVIGASAGGTSAIRVVLSSLRADFPGVILIAHHRGPGPVTSYRRLFDGHTRLRISEAIHGQCMTGGTVYVAPEQCHLELDAHGRLDTGQTARFVTGRPSVDLLFKSAAACYGDRTVAIVLSGFGRDGAAGVQAVRHRGGFVIAQDRTTSEQFGMPSSAIESGRVDITLPLHQIGFALAMLFGTAT